MFLLPWLLGTALAAPSPICPAAEAKGFRAGSDGVIHLPVDFRTDDFSTSYQQVALLRRLLRRLESEGVHVIVVPIPRRAMVHPERIPAPAPPRLGLADPHRAVPGTGRRPARPRRDHRRPHHRQRL